jgi:exosortase
MKEISFPLFFLIFMFPLPSACTNDISYHLKFLSANMSAWMLHATAYGNVIVMPHGQVVVNDACSGIRGILSLFAMSTVFIYWMKSNVTRKILVVIAVIPIALIVNAIRISFLGIVTEHWGAQYTKGLIHDIAGLLFFGLSFGILFSISRILIVKSHQRALPCSEANSLSRKPAYSIA